MRTFDRSIRKCPFCGFVGGSIVVSNKNTKPLYRVSCDKCNSSGSWAYSEDGAKKAWNRRADK